VSLLVHARDIERAVMGELAPVAEARLFTHLRWCTRCQARYDQLAGVKAAFDGGKAAGARTRARLVAALDDAGAARARPHRRRWFPALLVLAPAAAILVWIAKPAAPPPSAVEEMTMRGGSDPTAAAPAPALVIYASRKTGPASHGPVRLVAELPGSGEARVSRDDYLQLGVRGLRAATHVRVVGVDARGAVREVLADTLATPAAGSSAVGRSVELGRGQPAETLPIVALFSVEPIDDRAVNDAIAGRGGAGVITGALVIEP
jgi:hypothetical protein